MASTAKKRLLDFSTPHLLRNSSEYKAAVAEIDGLLDVDPERGTVEYDRLDLLSVLVEAYEDEHYPLDESEGTPQSYDGVHARAEGMTRAALHRLMGGKARASEFLRGSGRCRSTRSGRCTGSWGARWSCC